MAESRKRKPALPKVGEVPWLVPDVRGPIVALFMYGVPIKDLADAFSATPLEIEHVIRKWDSPCS